MGAIMGNVMDDIGKKYWFSLECWRSRCPYDIEPLLDSVEFWCSWLWSDNPETAKHARKHFDRVWEKLCNTVNCSGQSGL